MTLAHIFDKEPHLVMLGCILFQVIITDHILPVLLIPARCKMRHLSLRLVPSFARAGHIGLEQAGSYITLELRIVLKKERLRFGVRCIQGELVHVLTFFGHLLFTDVCS